MPDLIKIILIVLGVILSQYVLFMLILSYALYVAHLKRTSKKKWTRECSSDDPVQLHMYNEGLQWSESFIDKKKDLHMINDGLNLYAEYYDLGSKNTAIIVSGRTEGLRYAYYFAKPYTDMGWNVLCIDQRAHGNSDGKYNTLGFNEHKDIIKWADLLKTDFNVEKVVLHGICIGASASIFALTSENRSSVFAGFVAEGMYPCFIESFRNHMIELKHPTTPCVQCVDMWMRILTGFTMTYGPKNVIDRLEVPLLMLHSKEDLYSLPEEAQKLYDKCNSDKQLEWFEHGKHSQLRYTDREHYDSAVRAFIERHF